ncbi:hypothetical protein SAMN05444337_0431 [Flavobacterium haoranii]|uniref:Uncharacterized protein n=1 Tax=Flavobacterium haoranii TaxID=683124 RepID=A0A1M6CP65_9FLAO|nr:hypothetical protein SAMN05444337_0431 [Flavobacterium haoranii]
MCYYNKVKLILITNYIKHKIYKKNMFNLNKLENTLIKKKLTFITQTTHTHLNHKQQTINPKPQTTNQIQQ